MNALLEAVREDTDTSYADDHVVISRRALNNLSEALRDLRAAMDAVEDAT